MCVDSAVASRIVHTAVMLRHNWTQPGRARQVGADGDGVGAQVVCVDTGSATSVMRGAVRLEWCMRGVGSGLVCLTQLDSAWTSWTGRGMRSWCWCMVLVHGVCPCQCG